MAALISSVMDTKDKVPFFVAAREEMGIEILPPDVNLSDHEFVVVEGNIRFGLDAVKGVGYQAVEAIKAAREEGGPFELAVGLLRARRPARGQQAGDRGAHQVRRVRLDRRARARACSRCSSRRRPPGRSSSRTPRSARARSSTSATAAAAAPAAAPRAFAAPAHPPIPTEEFDQPELLAVEKESIGLFISAHPLKQVREALRARGRRARWPSSPARKDGDWVTAGGIITAGQEDPHQEGRPDDVRHARRPRGHASRSSSSARRSPSTRARSASTRSCSSAAASTTRTPTRPCLVVQTGRALPADARGGRGGPRGGRARRGRPGAAARPARRRAAARLGHRRAQARLRQLPRRVRGRPRHPRPRRARARCASARASASRRRPACAPSSSTSSARPRAPLPARGAARHGRRSRAAARPSPRWPERTRRQAAASQRRRQRLGPPERRVPLERRERRRVERLHRRRERLARRLCRLAEPAPDVEAVLEVRGLTAGRRRQLGDLLRHRGEAARRHPDAQPAVAQQRGAVHRGPRAPGDRDADRRVGRREDQRVADVDELALQRGGLAAQQRSQERQALVHTPPARARVDAADLDLVAILAADARRQREPAGRELGDRRHLPSDDHRVAQRQQVRADVDRQVVLHAQQRRGVDERVLAGADEEAHVVADAQMVQARGVRGSREPAAIRRQGGGDTSSREGSDAHAGSLRAYSVAATPRQAYTAASARGTFGVQRPALPLDRGWGVACAVQCADLRLRLRRPRARSSRVRCSSAV